MNVMKTMRLVLSAFGLVALFSATAAAQAPVLTATANGSNVSISFTAVPGATGYNFQAGTGPGLANILSVNVPGNVLQFAGQAPPGTYYLRVRATAGSILGPFSNEVVLVVGAAPPPGPCVPPSAPTATATAQGATVTVGWNPIAGVTGYLLQFSRFPGGTELVQQAGPGVASYLQYIGMLGTFYVRVIAVTPCGNAVSNEVQFTITDLASGPGPRTANPPPGQMLPIPAYGAAVVAALGAQFPAEAARARPSECPGGSNTFLYRVVRELRKQDSRWGLNYKRGQKGTLSEDIITYNGTANADEGESHVYVIDIVGGDCLVGIPTFADKSKETWSNRGQPYCGTEWCAYWTLTPYIAAGFPPDPRDEQQQ